MNEPALMPDGQDPRPFLYVEDGWPEGTGASPYTRALIVWRAGHYCEWQSCRTPGSDIHHRLNRKAGGRHGLMHDRLNSTAALLLVCRRHHEQITSAHGMLLGDARDRGWLLREHQHPEDVPVWTRHRQTEPVWLLTDGTWFPTTLDHPNRPATAWKDPNP